MSTTKTQGSVQIVRDAFLVFLDPTPSPTPRHTFYLRKHIFLHGLSQKPDPNSPLMRDALSEHCPNEKNKNGIESPTSN